MYTLIRLRDGTIMEAVVLANKQSRMRLAVAGRKDAMELQLCGLDWFDERNEPVQFGFLQIGRASCRERGVDLGGRRIIKKRKKKEGNKEHRLHLYDGDSETGQTLGRQ